MKLILLYILIIAQASHSQQEVEEFKNQSFKTVVRAVQAYMLDYQEAKESITDLEKTGLEKTLSFLENLKPNDSIDDRIEEFRDLLLKNGWSNNGVKLYQRLLEKRSSQIDTNNYDLSNLLNGTDIEIKDAQGKNILHYKNWNNLKNELISAQEGTKSIIEAQENASIREDETDSKEKSIAFNIIVKILTWIGIFGLGAFVGFKIGGTKSDNQSLQEHEAELINLQKNLDSKNLRIQAYEARISELNKKYDSLKAEHAELSKPPQPKPDFNQDLTSPPRPDEIATISLETNNIISHFFTYPDENGVFKKEFSSSMKKTESFFEILHQEGKKEAQLKFVADRKFYPKILSIRDTSLRPVCEIEDPNNVDQPSDILVIQNGVVEQNGDEFSIIEGQKIKIKIS